MKKSGRCGNGKAEVVVQEVIKKDNLIDIVVVSERGKVLARLKTNEKGYRKSIETGRVWYLHERTGRLLPFESGAEGGKNQHGGEDFHKEGSSRASGSAAGVLKTLSKVISDRRKKMPEGSYTSHLFREGGLKIRKKLGEEAVELVLARNHGEVVYEAADLIYHLLVLLEEEGIGIDEVLDELESRME